METIKVYSFDELSEEAQDKAVEELSDINLDSEFYAEFVLDDAKQIGLDITDYDLYRMTIGGRFLDDGIDIARKIVKEHGPDAETHKTAQRFIDEYQQLPTDDDGELDERDVEEIEAGFLHDILEDYRIILQHEYEYQGSREAIIETIRANDYLFFDTGRPYFS